MATTKTSIDLTTKQREFLNGLPYGNLRRLVSILLDNAIEFIDAEGTVGYAMIISNNIEIKVKEKGG